MLGILFLAAAAAAAPADEDPLVTFKDWVAGCDNGRACMAVGQFNAENFELASMVVQRGPLAGDAADVWFRDDGDPVKDLAADGKPLGLKFVKDQDRYGVDQIHVAPGSMPAFIAALKSAKSMTTVTGDGKPGTPMSINGATAAMRWIDDQQKRVGTVTALVATGDKPASAVPAPPPLPTVSQAIPSGPLAKKLTDAEIKAVQEQYAECSDDEDLQDKVDYARIDAHTTLALVTAICGSGAYNYYGIPLLIADNGKRTEAPFEKHEESDLTMNLSWDSKTNVLSSYFKGRGIGDCGGGTDWVWDGKMFRIIKETVMGECLGAIAWIPVFRARPVPAR